METGLEVGEASNGGAVVGEAEEGGLLEALSQGDAEEAEERLATAG